ncbi:hypothetical protein V6N13_045930 [Hibiscus sabdariffa]
MANEEPNFRKIVLETEVVEAMLQLNRWDFDAFIRPYMSPGHITSLSEVGGCCHIIALDAKTGRVFSVELVRHSDGYLLMGNGVSAMIRQNIFVVGYEICQHANVHIRHAYSYINAMSISEHLGTNDAASVTCSVGSCSVSSNNFYRLRHCVSTGPIEVVDGECSDAESFCPRGDKEGNCLLSTKEELAAEIHKIELHAYRCTLEALHASGPLSWELETIVTNEHLMELRNLISSDTSIPIR